VEAVVVTHHHHDHIGAVELVARHTGAPVWAHPRAAEALAPLAVARTLTGGEVIDLPTTGPVRVIHTPGHTRDHLALFVERCGDLIAGDMVSTISTILIDPPEGDLVHYLASLARLLELPGRMLYPAHGSPTARVRDTLRHYIDHRQLREQKTLAALSPEARPLSELVRQVYDDVDAKVHRMAERNLLANLLKLESEGRAQRTAEGAWRRGA
jgi:glyoxylase-like metal-dependent hydrolase (beta-lactamase superfamily II)